MTDFLLLALAVWRLASLLVNEDGPGAVFARLRHAAGLRSVVTKDNEGNPTVSRVALNPLAEGLSCIWCVSVWAAALLALPFAPVRMLRLVLAASAGAIVIHETVEKVRQ